MWPEEHCKTPQIWFQYHLMLVSRKANEGQYAEAIKDFETALTLNHSHANAKKYLVETQTAQGEK